MNKKSIEDVYINEKNVVIRFDFNVPISNGIINNYYRIDKSIPTIEYCLKKGAKRIVLISHLGRPNGKFVEKYSLLPIKEYLEKKLNKDIELCSLYNIHTNKQIVLLENIRFYKSEESKVINNKVKKFRDKLTQLGDIYINNAFGCSHREHSSIVGINCKNKVSGLLVRKEIQFLSNIINKPKKPFIAIIGGSKVLDKIKLLKNLMNKIDHLIIGGAMAFTFLKRLNINIGDSIFDKEGFKLLDEIYHTANMNQVQIHLQEDTVISKFFNNESEFKTVEGDIPNGFIGLDIGPKTIKKFSEIISNSNTILWNGPMGVFEFSNFKNGSVQIAEALKKATLNGATSIVGGGDTASCVINFGYENYMSHISTGGGASLELLEGKDLPGIKTLDYLY